MHFKDLYNINIIMTKKTLTQILNTLGWISLIRPCIYFVCCCLHPPNFFTPAATGVYIKRSVIEFLHRLCTLKKGSVIKTLSVYELFSHKVKGFSLRCSRLAKLGSWCIEQISVTASVNNGAKLSHFRYEVRRGTALKPPVKQALKNKTISVKANNESINAVVMTSLNPSVVALNP